MRPTKLTLSAFEAYAGLTEIDMDKLGKSGIYLICGDTGAGKTTIFDAICYALYDETSGGVRSPNMLRSQYAKDTDETYVILEFVYDGKIYKIKRNPEYERPLKRGEGITTQQSGCELTLPDGRVITGRNAVKREIEKIIGVNKAQFSQIAMIAQGDFMKLIHATTRERTEIFRRLFDTQKYLDLQYKLKEKTSRARAEYEQTGKAIKLYVNSLSAAEEDVTESEEVCRLKDGEIPIGEADSLCERIISADIERIKKLDEEKSVISQELEQKKAEMTKAKIDEKNKREFDNIQINHKKLETAFLSAEKALKQALEKKPESDKLAGVIAVEEKSLADYDEYDNANKKLKQSENTLSVKKKEHEKLAKDLEEKKNECSRLEAEHETLKKSGENLIELKNQRDNAESRLKALNVALADCDEYADLQDKYRKESKVLEGCLEKQSDKQEKYDKLYIAFLDGQAGIMGSRLKKGKPCPVCGSCEHPSPAKKVSGVPSEAALKTVEKELKTAKGTADNQRIICTELAAKSKAKTDTLKAQLKELLDTESTDRAKENISEAVSAQRAILNGFKTKIADEEQRVKRREELEIKLIPSVKGECEQKETALETLDREIVAFNTEMNHCKDEAAKMKEKLKYTDKREAQEQIDKLKKQRNDILTEIENTQKKVDTLKSKKTAAVSSLETLKKQLGGTADEDIEKLTEKRKQLAERTEKLSERLARLEKEREVITVRISTNKSARENIAREAKKQEKSLKHYIMVNSLHQVASGQAQGKDKITLETYIQLSYFDNILAMANIRLLKMTNGQFEMKRPQCAANLVSQSALDIHVIDHWGNTERDIKTLSGGESFMSSLAFALGLSDMIQSQSGGIKLDTMFVDEGFGTLDENALEQAIGALLELSQSDRLIGIISHREEFLTRIDKQLRITKSPITGSRVRLVTENGE